jgi:peptide chain release factor 2
LRERAQVEDSIKQFEKLSESVSDLGVYLEMAGEGDEEAAGEFEKHLGAIEERANDLQIRRMLGGEYDANNAIVTIRPGAGGTESQDWTEMLLRMYLRWAERKGFETKILDIAAGEGAGIKTVTFSVEGQYAYGYMRAESGIHRLVRISPFDNAGRRHTSFSSVYAIPEIDDTIEIDIKDDDLRIDTYRSSGAGGQHVNKTDSAVRLTHLPTNTVVACPERALAAQEQGDGDEDPARAPLHPRAREAGRAHGFDRPRETRGEVRQPDPQLRAAAYQLVKDLRTGIEVGNVTSVLDGGIDQFIQAYLMQSAGGAGESAPA